MKKLLMATAFVVLGTASAQAEISVGIGINQPAYPMYVEPAPVYVAPAPYYHDCGRAHHTRTYDWNYWRDHHEDRREGMRDEHHEAVRDDHHDNRR